MNNFKDVSQLLKYGGVYRFVSRNDTCICSKLDQDTTAELALKLRHLHREADMI
jgi:uncharacterized protein YqgQ